MCVFSKQILYESAVYIIHLHLGGPRVKKCREEVLEEQREQFTGKVDEVINSLGDPEEARSAGPFTTVTELEALTEKLTVIKEALRVSNLYFSPSGSVKKAHEDSFVKGFGQLPLAIRR